MSSARPPLSQSDLLRQWRNRAKPLDRSIPQRPAESVVHPTSGQARLWLLQELYPDNAFYQYGHRYHFRGPLDADRLEACFRLVIDRHEILRSNYRREGEDLLLVVRPTADFSLERADLSAAPVPETLAREHADRAVRKTFDLAKDPLLRATLLRLGPEEHWLIVSIHHIIGDRASLLVLNDEVYRSYTALSNGESPTLPELALQFPDFAHWRNQRPEAEASLAYWAEQLAGDLPQSALPFDRPRRGDASYAGATISLDLSEDVSAGLKDLARAAGTTANVVLLAVYQTLHLRFSAQKDLTVGTPISIRDRTELENMIGFLNETMVLRSQFPDPNESFRGLLDRVKSQVEAALEHKDVPFDRLVQHLQPARVPGANPLFQNMFVFNTEAPAAVLPAGLTVDDAMLDLGVAKFDQTLFATDRGSHFSLALEYATDLFEPATARRMLESTAQLAAAVVANPTERLTHLDLLPPAEKHRMLVEWNATARPAPAARTVVELIVAAARRNPEACAVADAKHTLTYGDLLHRADRLASDLRSAGTRPGDLVGLYADRHVATIVGLLGILRAGAAYVPLDPEYPEARTAYVVADAGIRTVVLLPESREKFPVATLQLLDIPGANGPAATLDSLPAATDLAYLIYTSGSTGQAKGVAITHGNLLYSTAARFGYFQHQPTAFLLLSSFAFDSSVAGIFWTLCQGGKLVLPPPRSEQDLGGLAGLIRRHSISHTLLLPSLYQLLLEFSDAEALASLRTVMVAGEACHAAQIAAHFAHLPGVELVNEYGPTEGTVWSTAHRIEASDLAGVVPIGRPIANVKHYVLDAHLQPVPVGVAGELYIGGPGLSPGYWQRPELTAERFPELPAATLGLAGAKVGAAAGATNVERARLYRTGDLVRYRPTGQIDFLGRADQQVKIRGFRVELEEISRQLEALPAVREAVTTVDHSPAGPQLVVYYTLRTETTETALRSALSRVLPAYMVPAVWVALPELPRLPNGKVATAALPAPQPLNHRGPSPTALPTTPTEQALAAIWEKVLQRGAVGLDDNYFSSGGDSIRSIRIIALASKQGLHLAPHHIFTYQTVRELAAVLDEAASVLAAGSAEASTVVPLRVGGEGGPLFCIHAGGGHVFFYQPLAQHLPPGRPVYAIQPRTLAGEETLPGSIAEMAADYLAEMRKVQPTGPYHLLGTCFSNAVVLELAHQLTAAGETIGSLFFIDSGPTRLEAIQRVRFSPLYTAVRILRERNWKQLRRTIYRYWFYTRQALGIPLEDAQGKVLRQTVNGLFRLYSDYDWRPVEQRLTLIRSTQFAGDPGKQFHLDQLGRLAGGGLDVRVTPGTHGDLFAEPYVGGLATIIEACLQEATTTVR
ncbi:non-ribosomal peptide synthetase [Neolewinella lacunae]|uniref:Amino acid adenylation domain-containing protein n=1 Tax=Neolewinella lacunae TaxID=1517758 RepID=A0A923T8N0_9BACT|nr:non-ribosomal peptide synthetase [Neolewinella lacunae]MBC6994138.1 amino acid adenylation domain-containing protein [Neolewinella lacunae]MDN3636713.1 non-ribosomal peptide synthetase [Neolewinella lacunae]